MQNQKIIYYECENPECGLRFPDLERSLLREHCPLCHQGVHPEMFVTLPSGDGHPDIISRGQYILEGFLDNIRSSYNVGSIFRTADGVGVSKLILGGITPTPQNQGVGKTALGAERTVAWEHINQGVEHAKRLKASGYTLWALEDVNSAEDLYHCCALVPKTPLVLVVGNEVCGIDPQILEVCDRIIAIPMTGIKRSYNVTIAFGIAVSYLRYCQSFSHGSDKQLPKTNSFP